MFDTV